MRFLELKKNLGKDFSGLKKLRVGLLGNSATQLLAQAMRGRGFEEGFDLEIFEADYDQVDRQILHKSSALYRARPEYVVLFESVQKLMKKFYALDRARRGEFAAEEAARIRELLAALNQNAAGLKIILMNYMELNDGVFGQFANKTEASFLYQLRRLNCALMDLARETKNLFICDIASLSAAFGQEAALDHRNHVEADMAFSLDFLPRVADAALDIVRAVSGSARKCLVLDLDNTLWGGVIGDDGIENIELGDLGQGKAFTELQLWARELKERGILLAICSKNDAAAAKAPFENHPDMVLSLDDIAIFVANWDSKVDNIKRIREFLNISLDAMVFVDDNPYERGVVKQHLPDIVVPELPKDPADVLPYLRGLNLFETASYTAEDSKRTRHFQQELKREETQRSFTDERDFLKSLDMNCAVAAFDGFNLPRSAQLIQRSNQFNLRGVRYTEEDLARIGKAGDHLSWTFTVQDKFGSYGLISVIIGKIDGGELFLDTWVMSCRVLKRGVEDLALNRIVADAKRRGVARIRGEYVPTAKNRLVENHYRELGFSDAGGGQWILDVEAYRPHAHFIAAEPAAVAP